MRLPQVRFTVRRVMVAVAITALLIKPVLVIVATLEDSKRTGDTIVSQIERYHSERGRYPERLDDLIPMYLPTIPRPADGEGFFYERNGAGFELRFGFWLSKGIDLYPRCTWDSRNRAWHVDA